METYKMMDEIKLRQYVVVPKKPKMSKGKLCSQVTHATFMALENQLNKPLMFNDMPQKQLIEEWKANGMCVIVLQCKTSQDLISISKYLEEWKIVHGLCIDEGLTEVEPFTPTALATGVLEEKDFWMFETLELFK